MGEERSRRRTKAVKAAEEGKPTGAGAQVINANKNVAIYAEWRSGVDVPDIAAEHTVSERRVQQIVDSCRAAGIEGLGLDDRLSAIRLGDGLLLRRYRAVSEAAKLIRRAEDQNNLTVALGAMRRRDEALTTLTEHLKDRGYLPRQLSTLRGEEEWKLLIETLFQTLHENGIHDEPGGVIEQLVEKLGLNQEEVANGKVVA